MKLLVGSGDLGKLERKQHRLQVKLLQRAADSSFFQPPDARRRVTSTTALRKQSTKL